MKCTNCGSKNITIRGYIVTCNDCCLVQDRKKALTKCVKNSYTLPTQIGERVEVFIDGCISRDSAIKATIIAVTGHSIRVTFENFYTGKLCKMTFTKRNKQGTWCNSRGNYILGKEGSGRHGWGPKDLAKREVADKGGE